MISVGAEKLLSRGVGRANKSFKALHQGVQGMAVPSRYSMDKIGGLSSSPSLSLLEPQ